MPNPNPNTIGLVAGNRSKLSPSTYKSNCKLTLPVPEWARANTYVAYRIAHRQGLGLSNIYMIAMDYYLKTHPELITPEDRIYLDDD